MQAALVAILLMIPAARLLGAGLDRGLDIRVLLFNYARTSEAELARAKREARKVYHRIGVGLDWVDCRISPTGADMPEVCTARRSLALIELRLLNASMAKGFTKDAEVCGLTLYSVADGSGARAYVFLDCARDLARRHEADFGVILGHVIAHELGHMLLGMGSHSAMGLMHNPWTCQELAWAARGSLTLSPDEAERIKSRLQAPRNRSAD